MEQEGGGRAYPWKFQRHGELKSRAIKSKVETERGSYELTPLGGEGIQVI